MLVIRAMPHKFGIGRHSTDKNVQIMNMRTHMNIYFKHLQTNNEYIIYIIGDFTLIEMHTHTNTYGLTQHVTSLGDSLFILNYISFNWFNGA